MTKKIIYTIISTVMIIAVLTGCHQAKETDTSLPDGQNTTAVITTESASETTTAESNTKADEPSTMNELTEKKTTESSTAKVSTTKAQSTTTTTKKHTTTTTTTKRVTTTQKKTTTQKPSTTHKATTTKKHTTEAPYFCDEGGTHHDVNVGPIGWVNTYDEAVDKALEYIGKHGDSGNFRVKQCYGCGKYTATVTID